MADVDTCAEVPGTGYLTTSTHESGRQRSASITPSFRSSRTFLEENPEEPDLKQSIKRKQTYRVGVKLSLWDRFRGIFQPQVLLNKIVDSIETAGMDEKVHYLKVSMDLRSDSSGRSTPLHSDCFCLAENRP